MIKRKNREMAEGTKVICEEFLNGETPRRRYTVTSEKDLNGNKRIYER